VRSASKSRSPSATGEDSSAIAKGGFWHPSYEMPGKKKAIDGYVRRKKKGDLLKRRIPPIATKEERNRQRHRKQNRTTQKGVLRPSRKREKNLPRGGPSPKEPPYRGREVRFGKKEEGRDTCPTTEKKKAWGFSQGNFFPIGCAGRGSATN